MRDQSANAAVGPDQVLATGASIAFLLLALIVLSMLPRAEGVSGRSVEATAAEVLPVVPRTRSPRPNEATVRPADAALTPDVVPRHTAPASRAHHRLATASPRRPMSRPTGSRAIPPARAEPATDDLLEDAAAAGMTSRRRSPDAAASAEGEPRE
jgi:hypothetical protein